MNTRVATAVGMTDGSERAGEVVEVYIQQEPRTEEVKEGKGPIGKVRPRIRKEGKEEYEGNWSDQNVGTGEHDWNHIKETIIMRIILFIV